MNEKEFTAKMQEVVTSSVQPLFEKMEGIKAEIDTKIKEATASIPEPKIEVGQEGLEKDPKGGFKSLGHFVHDIYKANASGNRYLSKELKNWERVCKAADSTTLSEADAEYGGFLVPPEYKNQLLQAVQEKNEVLARTTKVPMGASTVHIPYVNGYDQSSGLVWGGIVWYWTKELGTKDPSRPKFGEVTLSLKKMTGLAYSSDELIEDSPQSIEAILMRGFVDGLNYQLDNVFIRGTGAGQPLGVINSPCKVQTAKETGQAAATIVFENIVKMYSHLSDPTNAIWMANQNCLPQLATMSLAVGTGGVPVWLPANAAAGSPNPTLMGLPLVFSKHCSTLGTEGDIILCDWSQYLVGQKAGQGATGKFDTSIHFKFDADQTTLRFVFRIDGQPWWATYMTPPQATTHYISPFVTLATRS